MTARVVFTAGFSRRYTDGVREFTVEARNLRGVIKEMDRLYPGLRHHLEEETTVAIDGEIHETAYFPADPLSAVPLYGSRSASKGEDDDHRPRRVNSSLTHPDRRGSDRPGTPMQVRC
jgi:sulfur-carrier protein